MKLSNQVLKTSQQRTMLFTVFLIFTIVMGHAQDITISGNVTDDQNQPLPGANVLIKGTTNGTQTDFDGNYTINAPSGATLVVSYIGFTNQEVAVDGRTTINISLTEDASLLDEVVVVGYGSQRKTDLTGAVGQVDGDELGKFTTNDVTQSIQGRVAGVQIDTDGGGAGAGAFVTIRGSGTLSDAQPLYVVDGLFVGGIDNLNPADIESISVLKDASAAAIYGQRAANGVVIVTTKKGKKGKLTIDFEASAGFDQIINQLEFANARQYADIRNAANDNDGQPRAPANDTQFNPNIDTEIQDQTLRSGPRSNFNLRLSGGGENSAYSVSANRFDRKGILKTDEFERSGLRVNSSFEKGRVRFEQNLNLTQTVNKPNPYFNQERDHIPTAPIFTSNPIFEGGFAGSATSDGSLGFHGIEDVINSLGLAELEERRITTNQLQANAIITVDILDGLSYKLNAGINYFNRNNFEFTPTYFFAASNNGQNPINELDEENTNFLSTLIENTLNYNKDFGKHTVGLLAGFTEQRDELRSLGVVAQNFPSNDIRVASAAEDLQQATSEEIRSALRSWIGRVNYSYDSRYSFTGTIRRDGSSLFRSDLRFGNFVSAAVAWNVINESFMEKQELFDNLKFRLSYGELGSSNVDAYSFAPILNTNSSFITGSGSGRATGFAQTAGVNSELQWETTTTTNIGLEAAFLDNKLQITADYFTKESADIIAPLPPSNFLGFGNAVPSNAATIENNGFEFLANYFAQAGELNLNISANFSTIKNEVTSLGEGVSPIRGGDFTSNGDRRITRTEAGHPVGAFHGWKVIGIYQSDQEAIDDGRTDAVAGDLRFLDVDDDGDLDDDDRIFLGQSQPKFTYGFNIDANYKNWDMTLFFNGVSGNTIANASKWRFTFDTTSNYLPELLNAWTPTNTDTNIPRATLLDTGVNGRPSDYFLEDGDYFRLRNLQLGYTLPENTLSFLGVSRARLFFSATNLFTITGYTGYYPESGRSFRGNNVQLFNAGVDDANVPIPRTYNWGVQVSF
ncbi:SusC/RagA family TonB-linked outer membrane protein [Maribacter sp. 2210JD10-5]|uniref:SusC/RagA family TonB-linked outer membrane protein n=1 Tax=Maribacter sp. 2210JD10-5 TaxID=3386272 RepID=UPI0039BD7484